MNDPDPEIAVVLTAYAAFARGDIDQAIAGLHPHVEWIEPDQFPYGGRRVGPAAVAEYLRDSRSSWAELVSEPAATRRGNDIVVVHRLHGRLADGTVRDVTVADVFTFRNGLIVRMQAYTLVRGLTVERYSTLNARLGDALQPREFVPFCEEPGKALDRAAELAGRVACG